MNLNLGNLWNLDFRSFLPIIAPILVVYVVLLTIVFVDMYRNKGDRKNKFLWVIAIIVLNVFGPILYFAFGRRGATKWN